MLRAIADVLRTVGSTIAAIVTLPFRAVARLLGGVSDTTTRPRRGPRRSAPRRHGGGLRRFAHRRS